ncbi:MAG: UDP-N-acetylmuramate--L-alanine ligase [Actinobacteria bacterium]|nr:UDP-N-acetylmuramate--L-alanine ligase [Actinomycetota bacterium]
MAEVSTGPLIDLTRPSRLHVVGVGGPGMSAIATALAGMGHTVSGSDLKDLPILARLAAQGVQVRVGHDASHLDGVDAVAISTAIPEANLEVVTARERGVPVLRRAEILAAIAATRRTIAVSGTHGKTTTASMLALVLVEAGLRPPFIIGGDLHEIGSGAVWDAGEWFVVEADESDGTFLEIAAERVVVTNVEADHLDFFGDLAAVEAAFDRFLGEAPGPNVACADDPCAARLAARHGAATYGTAEGADYRIVVASTGREGSAFTVRHGGDVIAEVVLPVPGLHNVRNATAALVAGHLVGAPIDAAVRALARYAGVARRYEQRGSAAGVTFVDDYAHNPGKVRAVVDTACRTGFDRVVVVFQPHRYSRTAALWRDFGDSFVGADLVVVTDVYGAGEAPQPGVTGKLVVDAVLSSHPWSRVAWLPHHDDVLGYLSAELRPGDLCLTLGAGDITAWPDEIMARLRHRSAAAGRTAEPQP